MPFSNAVASFGDNRGTIPHRIAKLRETRRTACRSLPQIMSHYGPRLTIPKELAMRSNYRIVLAMGAIA